MPFFGKARTGPSGSSGRRFWLLVTRAVTRAPVVSIIAEAGPPIAATFFFFQINIGINGVESFTESSQAREAFFDLEEHFSFGVANPTEIVIQGDS